MKDNDIRKLSRTELLELLIEQTKANEALEKRVEESDRTIAELKKQLDDRRIVLEEAGSIAEASLRLNDLFKAAQCAADEYLENVRAQYERQMQYASTAEAETALKVQRMQQEAEQKLLEKQAEAQRIIQDAQYKAQQLLKETQVRCDLLESTTAQKCEEMTARAKRETQAYWDQVSAKLSGLMKQRT